MPPFRPPKERIDTIAKAVVAELKTHKPKVEIANEAAAAAIVRRVIEENLREEHAIEEEALAMLQKHGQEIYRQGADFQKILLEGKKVLARKKGFVL